jgi:hypothetical protein
MLNPAEAIFDSNGDAAEPVDASMLSANSSFLSIDPVVLDAGPSVESLLSGSLQMRVAKDPHSQSTTDLAADADPRRALLGLLPRLGNDHKAIVEAVRLVEGASDVIDAATALRAIKESLRFYSRARGDLLGLSRMRALHRLLLLRLDDDRVSQLLLDSLARAPEEALNIHLLAAQSGGASVDVERLAEFLVQQLKSSETDNRIIAARTLAILFHTDSHVLAGVLSQQSRFEQIRIRTLLRGSI